MKFLNVKIEEKSLNENGEISGYASVFNVKDAYNDVTIKGAFSKAVASFKAGKAPKLLWQHDASLPIGTIKEMYEDDHGLFIKCQLLTEIEKAREVYTLLKSHAIDGFSIGYRISDSYICNGVRYLKDVELLEISIVTFPACKEATVDNVKTELKTNVSNDNFDKKNNRRNDMNNQGNDCSIKNNNQKSLPLSRTDNVNFNDSFTNYGGCHSTDFSNYIRTGSEDFFKKSLSSASDESGGFFLPTPILKKINSRLECLSTMRRISNVMTISSGSVDLVIDSKNPDAGWIGDNGERNETDTPEIQKIKIAVHEVYAKPKANQRLLDDTQINVEEWLLSKISDKIATLENDAFINGDGEDKPKGFLKYEMVTDPNAIEVGKLQCFKSGANGDFAGNDTDATNLLIDMSYSIKPVYAKNAVWIMSRTALARIRKLRKNNGSCIWEPAIAEGTPSTLLGYPVYIDDNMPTLQRESPSDSVAFGDFHAGYQIVDRQGLKILRDPYTSKPFVEFYATKRTGGGVVDFDAIKILKFEEL